MRVSDDRYTRDRQNFDLALRLIRHEARTFTIRQWTGLSDDRIRKLYRSYVLERRRARVYAASRQIAAPGGILLPQSRAEFSSRAACEPVRHVRTGVRQRCAASSRAIASDRWNPAPCCAGPTRPIANCTRRRAFPSSTPGFCCWRWRGTMRWASRAARYAAACACAICWRKRKLDLRQLRRPPGEYRRAPPC